MANKNYPTTPDGRYFFAKNRLWRRTNPSLLDKDRRNFVKQLMQARLAVKHANDAVELEKARAAVHEAKVALGERGPVWWDDGAEDVNRFHPKNTPYADWWHSLPKDDL